MVKRKLNSNKIIVVSVLLVIVVALSIVAGVMLYREKQLNELQQSALQELEDSAGEYDEQKIVLYDTSASEARMLADKFNATLRITSDGKFATLTLADGTTVADVYSERANRKYLSGMSLDYYSKTSETEERVTSSPNYTVTDTYYSLQSYINYLNIGDAWTITQGEEITVAIIDTGIDTDHSEFLGRISEYSYNATEDKIVKDYTAADGGYDWSLIEDEQGHGTSVAGVIAASMDGYGITGIAPKVNLLIIKADCDESGQFTNTSDLVFGLYYAIEMNADVVNMSFGTYGVNPFASATKLAVDSDVICVAAAGNDATTSLCYPAADENVIGVGALADSSWELASYSNYGENSDMVAPGTTFTTQMGGTYGVSTGTSLASPVVAGAIALYLTQNRYSEFSAVVENLYASCYDLGSLGDDWEYGYGALDINALICEERGNVTFDMLTDEIDDIEQIFVVNHTLQNLPEPERTYAVFDGWYYDIECTEELNWYEDVFTADLTLYAKWVTEDDGVPYTYVTLDDGTIEIRSYTGKRRYITIPDMIDGKVVSSIGDEAFSGETRLRQVNLSSGLTKIGRNAFYNCSNLLEIEIPEGVTTIGEYAFYNCARLASVAFMGNSKLTTVGDLIFAYSGLTRFELPTLLNNINGSAFYGATSLKAITVASGNTYFSADGGVLFNYAGDTIIAYPAGLSGSYTIPDSVTTLGDYAFSYAKIKSIDLNNVKTIGNSAFAYSSLQSLMIPDGVTSLGGGAFAFNFYLKTVTLGSGLISISGNCFVSCSMLSSIEIPAGITDIGSKAFYSCTALSKVTFANGSNLMQIGDLAFYFTSIEEIIIPAAVIYIGGSAFAYDYYLSSVTFESGSVLHTIGSGAFSYDISLTEIALPDNLLIIGDYAFMESGLKTVTLPASLISLGAGAFASCHSLTAINVESGNAAYVSVDGVVYTIDKTEIVEYPAGNSASNYIIENTVTTVGKAAFYGSWNLITVELPSGLITISGYGFFDCESITVYTLPEGLTEIGDYALGYNLSLTALAMPDSLYQIGKYAVYYDYSLTEITFTENSTLPRISFGSFSYCGITSFRVPASVSTIAQYSFTGCNNLTGVTFAANSKLSYVSAYMFDGCNNLQSITFESGSALTSIEAHGFEGMSNLVSVDFGDAKLTNIDNYAFRYCESLTTLTIPDGVTYIGRYAFYACNSLESLTLPASIDYIGRYAFYAYGGVETNIYFVADTLPENLQENWDYGIGSYYVGVAVVQTSGDWTYATLNSGNVSIIEYSGSETVIDLTELDFGGVIVSIGGYAFYNTNVSSIVLPLTLTSIQRYAFARSKITEITIPDSVTFIGQYAFFYTPLTNISFGENSRLATIEQYAFYYTTDLKEITLPASLTSLGSYVFYYSGINQVNFADGIALEEIPAYAFADSGLTSVILPDSVTYINDNAFRNCLNLQTVTFGAGEDIEIHSNAFYNTGLTSLYIPANVRYIGEYAFVGLTSLTEFVVAEDNPNYAAYNGMLYNKDLSKLIAVPAAVEGTIYLPACIETIGYGALENTSAEAVVFDDNCNLLAIGYRAFYNAQNLTSVYIPASVVSIDFYAFAMCSNLTTVTFAEGSRLTGVYEGAFYGCISLTDILLPDSIIEISDYAFYGCSSLTAIPISDTSELKGIYDYAFAYSGITELNLPDTLVDIGNYAFRGCKLTSVYIPDAYATVLVIGIGAFADCEEITEITLPFIGASYEDDDITWFGYIFGAGGYEANSTYVPASLKTVTITEGITFIGTGAFFGLTNLEYINVPYSVTMLYLYSFYGTTAIYELTNTINYQYESYMPTFGYGLTGTLVLSYEIEYIQGTTFGWMTESLKVVLPYGLTSINDAFYCCFGLTELIIPETVTYIGERCFENCKNLGVIYNYSEADLDFTSCSRSDLKIVDKDGNSTFIFNTEDVTYLETEDGFRFKYYNGEYYFVSYVGDETDVVLPEYINGKSYYIESLYGLVGVTIPATIKGYNSNTFYDSYYLKRAVFSEGITNIGANLFSACYGLTYVEMPDTVTSIDFGAFQNCSGLVSIKLSANLKDIGDYAFQGCRSLTSIDLPSGITYLGNSVFANCTSLVSVDLPDNITSVGSSVFAGCSSLQTIYVGAGLQTIAGMLSEFLTYSASPDIIISEDNGYMCIDGDFVVTKNGTTIISCLNKNITSYTVPEGVTEISDGAFSGCQYLTEITLNDGILRIGDSAFSGCYSLKSIAVPDSVTEIGNYAFAFCYELEMAVLPQSIYMIPGYLFYNCYKLSSVTMPTSVQESVFGGSSFMDCRSLTELVIPSGITFINLIDISSCGIKELVIPASVTTVWYENSSCSLPYLQNIIVEEGNKNYYVDGNCLFEAGSDVLILGCANSVIPEYTKEIAAYAFLGNICLTEIVIPEGVEVIGDYAFSGSSLIQITLPSTLKTIGNYALNCERLYEVYNYSEVDILNGEILSNNVINDVVIHTQSADSIYVYIGDSYAFRYADGEYTMVKFATTDKDIVFPGKELYQYGINSYNIDEYLFYQNAIITSVTFSDSVKSIGAYAFNYCVSLSEINFSKSITQISFGAFYYCYSLTQIDLSPIEYCSIDFEVFYGCSVLSTIVMPQSVSYLHRDAFKNTAYFNNAQNWEDGGLYCDNYLLYVESDVTEFTVKDGTDYIAYNAFYECYSLTTVTIGGEHSNVLYYLTNIETLIITQMPSYVADYFWWAIPLTLSTVVIKNGAEVRCEYAFSEIADVTIFAEASSLVVMWDDDYPGWNNGNTVIYGGKFISAEFYDSDGTVLANSYYKTSQVIRQPYVSDYVYGAYRYTFIGWDTDGDGAADFIPATSSSDITATALYSVELRCVTEGHSWDSGEVTLMATCLSTGERLFTCIVCGETYTESIQITDHTAGTAVKENEVAATCTAAGSYDTVVYCTVCNTEISRETTKVEAVGHSWNDGVVIKEATATESGERTYTCTDCGETYTEVIPATGSTDTGSSDTSTDTGSGTSEGGNSGSADDNKKSSGCGSIIGAGGSGNGNLLIVAAAMLMILVLYIVVRRYKNR